MRLSIIIPVYNEEKTVGKLIKKVLDVDLSTFSLDKELVLIDDGSKDKSKEVIKNFSKHVTFIEHAANKGKGAAIKTGLKYAKGDLLLIQDSDLEYDPRDYKKLLKVLFEKKAKVVYGSRFLTDNKSTYLSNYLGNKVITFLTNLLYGSHLTDMETCYKLFSRDVLKGIDIKSDGFDFEPEFTAKLLKKGYRIEEVPISYDSRSKEEGKKIRFKDGLDSFKALLKYRFKD